MNTLNLSHPTQTGIAETHFFLGKLYYEGSSTIVPNYNEAYSWFMKAATSYYAPNAKAQFFLGMMYQNGQGIEQDSIQAAQWYNQAALQGDPEAQYCLGLMYMNGEGVAQDFIQAHIWFNLAATFKDAHAQRAYPEIEKKMTRLEIKLACKSAREWLNKHPTLLQNSYFGTRRYLQNA
jgi:TPR repeat protein